MQKVKRSNARQRLRALKETLKPMSHRQRIAHIWTYYKLQLLIVVVAVILIITAIGNLTNAGKEALISGVYANVDMSQEGWRYVDEQFFAYMGGDAQTQSIQLSATDFSGIFSNVNIFDSSYTSAMNPVAMVSGGSLDYLIMDEAALRFYMTQEILLDLTDFFTPDELDAFGERVIYLELVDESDVTVSRCPVAIDISELPFSQDCLNADGCYFSLSVNTSRLDACRIFWSYLLAWKA